MATKSKPKKKTKKYVGVPVIHPFLDPEKYVISEDGFVTNTETGLLVRRWVNRNGYSTVTLDGKMLAVHKLLVNAYIPKSKKDIEYDRDRIMFIDGDRENLELSNLRWANAHEINIRVALKNLKVPRTEKVMAKYICILLEEKYTQKDICAVLDMEYNAHNKKLITDIKNRRIYEDVSKYYTF